MIWSFKRLFKYVHNLFKPKDNLDLEGIEMPNSEFKMPKVPRNYCNSMEVILYSFYLKTLEVDQTLNYGDWYYVNDPESGYPLCKVYHKDQFDFGSFELFSKNEYVRMVTQDEALHILHSFGYNYADDTNPIVTMPDGQTMVNFDNDFNRIGIVTTASSAHAAHLKAAYLVSAQVKQIFNTNNALRKYKFFKFHERPGEEFDEGNDANDDATEE